MKKKSQAKPLKIRKMLSPYPNKIIAPKKGRGSYKRKNKFIS